MTLYKAIDIWESVDRPIVHLGHGKATGANLPDLDIVLADPNRPDSYLRTIKYWLNDVMKKQGIKCM